MSNYTISIMENLTPELADLNRINFSENLNTKIECIYLIEQIEVEFDGYDFWQSNFDYCYLIAPDGRQIEIEADQLNGSTYDELCWSLDASIDPSDYYPFGE